ncbi:DUF3631 domain-containing protein [Actinokineospora iranica]|uniref:3'-phosphoadenosine 5'-phosphosulfate sulfotransferase (PAPS reductase)/FAD synthetase n=1 Tax=Actinokineospora iranica TaxID=1271860 RepID=A0A1G6WQI6_9PSEU|nr:DUF3631 domain-containing protein [Actinokineospora iranica]SDD68049.1 3'-phosphoadenosine 5'-phosphosulfate sulfotransferase (PAPS reductase)/FAD synthetase [Actinokineospora iranica]
MSIAVTAPLWPEDPSPVVDPLRPGTVDPTPDEVVAALSPADRRCRVLALVEQAHSILAEALAEHAGGREIVGVCLLWSGGNDSNVLAHLMRSHATHVVHANTGIGIEQTRRHVRETAAAWGLPLIEKHPPPGSTYRDYVLKHGFPGPGQHYRMYQRLKERALRQARAELVGNGHRQRVVFLAGRRRAESARRAGQGDRPPIPLHEREDSVIWVSPIAMWTKLDLNTYRSMHPDVPHNEVCDHLHMSGECLCGSFAKPGELDQIRDFYPDTATQIDTLAAEARAAGVPEPRCRWGWGATRGSPVPADQPLGRLCTSCTAPQLAILPGPEPGDTMTAPTPNPPAATTEQANRDRSPTPLRAVPDPTPSTLDGAVVLDSVRDFVSRFSAFPSEHCAPMLALWYAHTWVADAFYITPRLILSSPEPGSGKTRVLEIAQHLTKEPEMTAGGSAAALVRMVAAGPITVLMDEVDAIFGAGGSGNEEVRQMLNLGYKRSATVPKTKGDPGTGFTVERLPIFAPTALAGLAGRMPDTITTRAITIHLRRRRQDEHVEAYRESKVIRQSEPIREALSTWLNGMGDRLVEAEPEMPPGVDDRPAEIWEPLLAIAELAGGHWPTTARAACSHFVFGQKTTPSLGVRLLSDLRDLFAAERTDRMHTSDILARLRAIEDSPWPDLGGKPLDAQRLAKEMSLYQVAPMTFKHNNTNAKGYVTFPTDTQVTQVGLADAWARYLPVNTDQSSSGN